MNITPFIVALKKLLNEHKTAVGLTFFDSYDVIATEGSKYFKVYRREVKEGQAPRDSIVAFIDKTTGDIFKPASCKIPAKHARGNVNSPQNGMEAINNQGFVHYLK